mgnify:CR=1 FL=1
MLRRTLKKKECVKSGHECRGVGWGGGEDRKPHASASASACVQQNSTIEGEWARRRAGPRRRSRRPALLRLQASPEPMPPLLLLLRNPPSRIEVASSSVFS